MAFFSSALFASLVQAMLPFAIKLMGNLFAREEKYSQARKHFISMIEAMQETDALSSARLTDSYRSQLERLKQQDGANSNDS